MESIWQRETAIAPRAPLAQDVTADVAVIGGGMAGILTAYLLQQAGLDAIVLEADRIGQGQTAHTTAKITSQHGLVYGSLAKQFGPEAAQHYAAANQQAIERYREIIQTQAIPCGLEARDAYLYTTEDAEPLRQEHSAACAAGIPASLTTETGLPFPVREALRFPNQAQFQPLSFLRAIAENLTIYEHTRVTALDGTRLDTPGGTVHAKQVVVATHYPFRNAPGYYFLRMHQERSYVLALKNAPDLGGMYFGIDPGAHSMRNYSGLLLLGGGNHRTGENSEGGRYQALRQTAAKLFPGCEETAAWSAQDCITLDGLPYIGPYSEDLPGVFVATGFHKWGMTGSMVAAELLTNQILRKTSPFEELFSPRRFQLSAAAQTMMTEGLQATKGLARHFLTPPRGVLDALPRGHGGIVAFDGHKAGIYKDTSGEIFVVSPFCPHLGCQLEWNPDEKSWDCPCHGSRFDCHGNLIDNPAEENLKPLPLP